MVDAFQVPPGIDNHDFRVAQSAHVAVILEPGTRTLVEAADADVHSGWKLFRCQWCGFSRELSKLCQSSHLTLTNGYVAKDTKIDASPAHRSMGTDLA